MINSKEIDYVKCKYCGHEIELDKVLGGWIHKKVRSNGKCGMFKLIVPDKLSPTYYCDCDNPEFDSKESN